MGKRKWLVALAMVALGCGKSKTDTDGKSFEMARTTDGDSLGFQILDTEKNGPDWTTYTAELLYGQRFSFRVNNKGGGDLALVQLGVPNPDDGAAFVDRVVRGSDQPVPPPLEPRGPLDPTALTAINVKKDGGTTTMTIEVSRYNASGQLDLTFNANSGYFSNPKSPEAVAYVITRLLRDGSAERTPANDPTFTKSGLAIDGEWTDFAAAGATFESFSSDAKYFFYTLSGNRMKASVATPQKAVVDRTDAGAPPPKRVLRVSEKGDQIFVDATRTLAVPPIDRFYARRAAPFWIDDRYAQYDTERVGYIDLTIMKHGYLEGPRASDLEHGDYSPDHDWVIGTFATGLGIAHVVVR